MQNTLQSLLAKFTKDVKKRRRKSGVFLLLSLAVLAGVTWSLKLNGITLTGDSFCGYKEHVHSADCEQSVLVCGLEESEGHIHSAEAGCYQRQETLICALKEHAHGEACYDEEGHLTCSQNEHTHSGDCYAGKDVLICTRPESEGHAHGPGCYETQLICGLKEHTHSPACYSNQEADVETAADWEATLPAYLGEDWAENLLRVAQSQLGYTESTANFSIFEDGVTRGGYTRYGAWYGNPHGHWDAMFASFCLHYAQIPPEALPYAAGGYAWTVRLGELALYKPAANYAPQAGDLIFFDQTRDGRADRVGIVAKTEEQSPAITVIEGDSGDSVAQNFYDQNDPFILGYASLALAYERFYGVPPAGVSPEPVPALEGYEYSLAASGEDYTVIAGYNGDAEIAENAVLFVTEILEGTPEYEARYQALRETLLLGSAPEGDPEAGDELPSPAFARIFNVEIQADGVKIDPKAPVIVRFTFANGPEAESGGVLYFGDGIAQLLDGAAVNITVAEDGTSSVEFFLDGFSDIVIFSMEGVSPEPVSALEGYEYSLTASGEDYTVIVGYNSDAKIAKNAVLFVTEILEGTPEYEERYRALQETLLSRGAPEATSLKEDPQAAAIQGDHGSGDELPTPYFARIFNVEIQVDGVKIEPQAPVIVRFTFANGPAVGDGSVLHFGDESTELLDGPAVNTTVAQDGASSVEFSMGGFSDIIIFAIVNFRVWFAGANDGIVYYTGATNTTTTTGNYEDVGYITLPTSAGTTSQYGYTLNGWLDVTYGHYYGRDKLGTSVPVYGNTVFYADWVATSYNVGQTSNVVTDTPDTSSFITTRVFDYNELFNYQSANLTQTTFSQSTHQETWSMPAAGKGINFLFYDNSSHSSDRVLSRMQNRATPNTNAADASSGTYRGQILSGILSGSIGADRKSALFTPENALGKTYVGRGNYLYRYNSDNGYYYYDSSINAASYHQSAGRFYVYNYPVRVNSVEGFLPFNYSSSNTNFSRNNGSVNYFFGMSSEIEFFLPNNSSTAETNPPKVTIWSSSSPATTMFGFSWMTNWCWIWAACTASFMGRSTSPPARSKPARTARRAPQ